MIAAGFAAANTGAPTPAVISTQRSAVRRPANFTYSKMQTTLTATATTTAPATPIASAAPTINPMTAQVSHLLRMVELPKSSTGSAVDTSTMSPTVAGALSPSHVIRQPAGSGDELLELGSQQSTLNRR